MTKQNNTTKGDEDSTTPTKEVIEVTDELSWCIFCGNQSRKKQKRDTCDTYQAMNNPKQPKGLKKWQNKLAARGILKKTINHIWCSKCGSRTCKKCIVSICDTMLR